MSTETESKASDMPEEHPCEYFDRCGNFVPPNLSMCDQCTDEARRRQRKFEQDNPRATALDYGDHLRELGYA